MDALTRQNFLQQLKHMVTTLSLLPKDVNTIHCQLMVIQLCLKQATEDTFASIDKNVLEQCMKRLQFTESACSDMLLKPSVVIMSEEDMASTMSCLNVLLDACIQAHKIEQQLGLHDDSKTFMFP